MASYSLQIANPNQGNLDSGNAVTAGTAAPTTGSAIELRIDLAGNWDLFAVRQAFATFLVYLSDPEYNQSLPMVNASNS